MFSKIALCSDAESSSVTGFDFHLMQVRTRFSLRYCLKYAVAVIHLGDDPENNVTHRNPVFCSSNNTCKKTGRGEKPVCISCSQQEVWKHK